MSKTTPVPELLKCKIKEAHALDPSVSARKLAKFFRGPEFPNLHHKTVSRILKEGSSLKTYADFVSKAETKPFDLVLDEPEGAWVQNEKYVYNGDSDTYITFLRCRPKPLVINGNKFRSMKKAYSDWDGNPATINEICRRFAIPRDQFQELKAVHGWTHESEPFTREEVMSREVDDLADDAFQQRRQAVWESFEKKRWHQIKVDAEKWNSLDQNFIQPLQDKLASLVPDYAPPRINLKSARNPFAVVTSAGELHYGGSGWIIETGENFSRQEAAERLTFSRQVMLEEVADRGCPERFYYALGHDFLTVDTDLGTTTRGTPQELDGTVAQIFAEGFDLALRDIDCLRSVAPVQIIGVPGNHDRLLTVAMLKGMEVAYRGKKDVAIEFSAKSRAYSSFGDTIFGFAHGDGALNPKDYMATMAKEAPALWADTVYRAFFTGHLHSEVVRELVGGTHYQMPSLRGKDRFHERNAYLADAALASYIVDKRRGVVGSILTRP
jgi:hypothetical protein